MRGNVRPPIFKPEEWWVEALSVLSALVIFILFLCFLQWIDGVEKKLDNEACKKRAEKIEKIENNKYDSLILSDRSWYVVDSVTVSSEKDGKGLVIKLPQQLRSRIEHPVPVVKNIKVSFSPVNFDNYRCSRLELLGLAYTLQK